jgi:MFS superfamily sulfate permease-like transporter
MTRDGEGEDAPKTSASSERATDSYGREASTFQPAARRSALHRLVPVSEQLPGYHGGTLRRDLLAGVTVAALALPAAMVYAELAGLSPVAGLYALLLPTVAVLIAWGLFEVPLLAPTGAGTLGDASTAGLAGLAAAAALLATGLMHLLLLSTPRPGQFFRWIMGLATLIAAITPFLTDAEQNTKIATAAIYVAIGATIASLISSVARSAVRSRRANPPMAGS